MVYEVELIKAPQEREVEGLIAVLTGLPLCEVIAASKVKPGAGWYGREMRDLVHSLGFNCSPRFLPFDPNTPYPALMRYVFKKENRGTGWDVLAYNDRKVYLPVQEWVMELENFKTCNRNLKITSMMQVWI
jgi:hypothetical protein